jgi:hypothetical protein
VEAQGQDHHPVLLLLLRLVVVQAQALRHRIALLQAPQPQPILLLARHLREEWRVWTAATAMEEALLVLLPLPVLQHHHPAQLVQQGATVTATLRWSDGCSRLKEDLSRLEEELIRRRFHLAVSFCILLSWSKILVRLCW